MATIRCRIAMAEISRNRPDGALKEMIFAEEVMNDSLYPSDEMRVSALRSISEVYLGLNLMMDALEYADRAVR